MNEPSSLFAVAGATGQTGAAVAEALLRRGARVRALVRARAQAAAWAARGAEAVVVDIDDPSTLARALAGAAGAYVLNPPAYAAPDLFAVAQARAKAWTEALASARVGRVVALSSIGAQLARGTGNILTNHVLERTLRAAGLAPGCVRAAWFMENWRGLAPEAARTGVLPTLLAPPERAIDMVAVRDIGETVAALLHAPEDFADTSAEARVVELTGPRACSPADVAAAISRVAGRPVRVEPVPPEAWPDLLATWGNSPRSVAAWTEMLHAFNDGTVRWEGGPTAHTRRGRFDLDEMVRGWLAAP